MALQAGDGANDDERAVLRFFDLWKKQDVDAIVNAFADGASYIDMPLPPRHGLDEIRAYIAGLFTAFAVEIETLRIASANGVVFTERVDYLIRSDGEKPPVPLPVTGVMEMKDGKIAAWRDYLDLATAERGLGLTIHSDSAPEAAASR